MLKLHSDEEQTQDKDRKGWLDKYVDGYERDAGYIAEGLALRLIEQAISIMEERGISRSDLASLMGVSRSHITRMFNAPPNLTLRSIAQLAGALGVKAEVSLTVPSAAASEESAPSTPESEPTGKGSDISTTAGAHKRPWQKLRSTSGHNQWNRITLSQFEAKCQGEHDNYHLSYTDGRWNCSCNFFGSWGVCTHAMAFQKLMSDMLPTGTLPHDVSPEPAPPHSR